VVYALVQLGDCMYSCAAATIQIETDSFFARIDNKVAGPWLRAYADCSGAVDLPKVGLSDL